MVSETKDMASENASQTPDDEEAAEDSREQGQKMNQSAADAENVDSAIAQTKERAQGLMEDAAQAKQLNTQSRTKIDETKEMLGQSHQRLDQMNQQNAQARSQVEGLANQPEEIINQSSQLDQQGQTLINSSMEIERRLVQVQADYMAGMSSIPAEEAPQRSGMEASPVQMQPEEERAGVGVAEAPAPDTSLGGELDGRSQSNQGIAPAAEDPYRVDIATPMQESMPDWLTGESDERRAERQQHIQENEQRRAQQLQEIDTTAGGNFENLSAWQKMGMALSFTWQNLSASLGQIQWPSWGQLALSLINPIGPLLGVAGGLSMIATGVANIANWEAWEQDPIGHALKIAADIATGLTIVFGSITALAGVIIAIMAAITLLSFGTAAPVTGPIIAFCATVLTTVGGWTIAVGKIALVLQALSFIWNLIQAATAKNAEDLLSQSEQMTENVKDAGGVLLQMGMAKLGQIGGRNLKAQIQAMPGPAAAGPVAFARAMPARFAAGVRSLPATVAGAVHRGISSIRTAPGRARGWLRDRLGRGGDGTPPPRPGGAPAVADDLADLRLRAKTDPDAAHALVDRYRKMSDFELFRRYIDDADETASAIIRQRYPDNETALKRILRDNYRPPHEATAILRRAGAEVSRTRLQSGNMTPQERALGFPRSMNATHTEARAVRQINLQRGDILEIRGQYDPCPSCRNAMREAATRTGATIRYWWPGGPGPMRWLEFTP
jgi:hypothetical protein